MQRRSFLIAAGAAAAFPVLAQAQTQSGVTPPRPAGPPQITPANDLERAFVAALHVRSSAGAHDIRSSGACLFRSTGT